MVFNRVAQGSHTVKITFEELRERERERERCLGRVAPCNMQGREFPAELTTSTKALGQGYARFGRNA